jgi:hypothetical protein
MSSYSAFRREYAQCPPSKTNSTRLTSLLSFLPPPWLEMQPEQVFYPFHRPCPHLDEFPSKLVVVNLTILQCACALLTLWSNGWHRLPPELDRNKINFGEFETLRFRTSSLRLCLATDSCVPHVGEAMCTRVSSFPVPLLLLYAQSTSMTHDCFNGRVYRLLRQPKQIIC